MNPDGLYPRRAIGVNGQWPPPPLVGYEGDTIRMKAVRTSTLKTRLALSLLRSTAWATSELLYTSTATSLMTQRLAHTTMALSKSLNVRSRLVKA